MKQTYRSRAGQVLGWVWVVFAAVMGADLILRYNGAPSLVAAAVLAVLTVLIVVTSLRPATVALEDGVLVRNPLRDTFVPWTAVDDISVAHAITIEYGERQIRCWTPQSSARERASAVRRGTTPARKGRFQTEPVRTRAEQSALDSMAGRTHADFVADQLTERAEAAKRKTGSPQPGSSEVRTTWSIPALVLCAAALVLVIAAIIAS
jgi:hypothetical protein